MVKKVKLGLVARILLAMAIGIAAGFILPECGIRTLKTFEDLVTTLLKFMVPMVTIHLAGSMIKLVCCAAAMILMSGRTIDFGAMGVFIFVMTATAIAAPGVPGGVITSSLGALGTILLLTPEQSSMLMTVYLAMDGVGSACSVGGHGAIAMAVERIVGKGDE